MILTCPGLCAGAVELKNTLQNSLSMELPATLTFDYPTIGELVRFLAESVPSMVEERQPAESWAPGGGRLSTASIMSELQGMVNAMLATDVAVDQPLIEAGLESLGRLLDIRVLGDTIHRKWCALLHPYMSIQNSVCRGCGAPKQHRPALGNGAPSDADL